MSKSLKKLIDINRLREFKNKLVGTDSPYVQTGAVDQTIAGTKTFSKPIVGSVTGSSGSCTGNAATATKLATATSLWGNDFDGSVAITGQIVGAPSIELMPEDTANHGGYLDFHYNHSVADYTSRIIESDPGTLSINKVTITTEKVVTAATFIGELKGNVTGNCSGSSGSCTGNAASANIATKATQDSDGNKITTTYSKNGHTHDDRYYTENEVNNLLNGKANTSGTYSNLTVGNADSATNATNSNAANQLQAFVNDNFTDGNHYVKAIRSSQGWSTHLWMCYNNGAKMADEVSVNYANSAGSANTANSATNATYTNWLRTSSHSDHLFHTEWDGSYFWTYVTTGSGEYRAVRVARSDSSGNADHATSADSATRATSADRASVANYVQSQTSVYHEISFDWDSQVPGYVGLRVDKTDLGGIVTTNRLVSDIRAQLYAAYPDGAEAHNAMWGGRDITDAFDAGTVSEHIADGTFRDIFPGDYITKQVTISGTTYNVNWVIADCDYWINKGDQNNVMETHHVVIVPQAPIFTARMNPTNTTEGGYAGSEMYKNVIPACATGIVNAFGGDHILTFRDHLTRDLNTSAVSSGITVFTGAPNWNGEWYSQQCNLMSEAMIYGGPHCASSALDNTMATRQMSAFRLSERLINYNRNAWWLRDVVSSANFADVLGVGVATAFFASTVYGVRPFALLK